jgi:hypothetical protein
MSLRVHHLNCGTMCPHGGKLIGTPGGWLSPGKMVGIGRINTPSSSKSTIKNRLLAIATLLSAH